MTDRFDDTAKEDVRTRIDIAVVIGRYVNLKGSGQTLKGLCPFHKEKTPSFHVNPARGFFHCFGCGKGGDVFSFLQEIEGLSFPEALKVLADEAGVTLAAVPPRENNGQQQQTKSSSSRLPKTELLRIHDLAAKFYYGQIKNNPAVIDYFKSRGMSGQTVRDFHLGYAPGGWSSLINHLAAQGISSQALVECGLAIEKEGGGGVYDRFRDRVMFPLSDLSGRVIAFAGRGMAKDSIPKYLNSPETALYQKKGFLYGLHQARRAIKESGFVMIVEGYMDYLTLFQAGICNLVASSGTAFTADHAHMLSRFTSRVVLVFDGDAAGQTAAQRAVFILAPFSFDVSILVLPGDEDPDSFVLKHGGATFLELVKKARTSVDFIIEKTIAEHGGSESPHAKSAVIEQLAPLVRSINDTIAQARFKKELSERLNISEKLIYQRLGTTQQRTAHQRSSVSQDEKYLRSLEGMFLSLLLSSPDLVPQAQQYVAPETLTDRLAADIYSLVLDTYRETGSLDGIIDRIDDPEIKRLISLMLVKPALQEHLHEELVQKIIHLRAKYLRNRIRETKLEMNREPQQRAVLLQQLKEYSTQLKDLDETE